jgi:hypothetical protein
MSTQAENETLSQKKKKKMQKRACGVAQEVEHLKSKRKGLSITPSTTKKKKESQSYFPLKSE